MSNLGKWNRWYNGLKINDPQAYGNTDTYQRGAEFLKNCSLVEDWGCGKGWFSRFIDSDRYRGIDGSHTPWAANIVDLVSYKSSVPGIYMRHVIEHNYEWKILLENALESFTERMVLVLFTPLVDVTHEIYFSEDPGVPDIAFSIEELIRIFDYHQISYEYETISSPTNYGCETIIYLSKESL